MPARAVTYVLVHPCESVRSFFHHTVGLIALAAGDEAEADPVWIACDLTFDEVVGWFAGSVEGDLVSFLDAQGFTEFDEDTEVLVGVGDFVGEDFAASRRPEGKARRPWRRASSSGRLRARSWRAGEVVSLQESPIAAELLALLVGEEAFAGEGAAGVGLAGDHGHRRGFRARD